MRYFMLVLALVVLAGCKKSPYITPGEIEKLTGHKVTRVVEKRAYNINETAALENIITYQAADGTHIGAFSKSAEDYGYLGGYKSAEGEKILKVMFINPALEYSHIMVVAKDAQSEYLLHLFDRFKPIQTIKVARADVKNVFIEKNDARPKDELLQVGEAVYRFDSQRYIETFRDKPLPWVVKITRAGENSVIEMINRGGYTGRAVITISFPELAGNYREHVRLVKKIGHVKLYAPGQGAFRSGGGRVRLRAPSIEIIKEPFAKMGRMKLPLFLSDKAGPIQIRAVYKYRGGIFEWPEDENLPKDQQNYPAYQLN